LRNIKQIRLFALIAVISFGIGWCTNDMFQFAYGVKQDAIKLDSLKNNNQFFKNCESNEQLTEKVFYSPDNVTGGFSSTTLKLNKSGKLYLIDSVATLTNENNSGGIYSWTTDTTANGEWCLINENIYLKVQREDNYIKQTFLTDTNIAKDSKQSTVFQTVIVFSDNLDTIYINKTPCIKIK
jgi:predicted secreted protein